MMIRRDVDVRDFIINNVKGRTCNELADLVNKEFGLSYTDKQIKYYKRKYHLTSGVDCRFKKGEPPHNIKNEGHEFEDSDGYVWLKVGKKYVKKHRYIYEQHYGEIPKGYDIMFLDSDKTNFSIDNLGLVRHKDLLIMKNKHLCTTDKELTKTGMLLAQVINTAYEKKKELE